MIFILFDALREDYIEWPGGKQPYLDPGAPYAFEGKKVSLFRRLVESEPENAFLVPLRSEMPTITVVRIKTFLSGVTGSVVDFSEALVHGDFKEDNILVTLLKKFKEKASTICFGEDIWEKAFGPWFTKEVTLMDQNIRSLDANDNMVAENLFKELAAGSNFNFLIAHLIGMDHAGHSYDTRHPELQRKMHEVESTIEKVLQQIDDETTVVIFGDHGMTEDGSHGGSSDEEMRTVLFAYQKKPFPMGRKYRQFQDQFEVMDSKMKVADVAPIGAQLLNIPTPFSNIGNTHPIFT